jgi:hypothetical protein
MSLRLTSILAAGLLLVSCLPGDRAKDLVATSECTQTLWLRFYEDAAAVTSDLQNQRPLRVDPGATVRDRIFDNNADGISMAISVSETEVGKIVVVPHSEKSRVQVVITGGQCG